MKPGYLFFLALVGIMGACSGSHESAHTRPLRVAPEPVEKTVVLDVPGLLNLSIGELSQRLGPHIPVQNGFTDPVLLPVAKTQERVDSSALFRYRGLSLIVSYDHGTGQVNNLLLLGADEQQLMSRANLQLSDKQYVVLPVFTEHHLTRLLGVRVIATTAARPGSRY